MRTRANLSAMKAGERSGKDEDAGRTCPYCRFTLKPGVPVVDCDICGAAHHAECWADNGGCAVFGCTGGPSAGADAPPLVAAPPPVVAAPPVAAAPAPSRSRSSSALVVAVLLLALALAGGAVAIVLTDEDTPVPAAAPTAVTVNPTVAVSAGPALSPPAQPTAREQRVAAIEPLVRSYFDAIRAGDYDAAWELLSVKYRTWKLSAGGGRAKWERQEASVPAHLTGTPTVRETQYDPASGVSTIFVSGLNFPKPDGTSCAYQGFTWARRSENGWAYDQGYLHVPARRARWRPIREQTLGFPCDASGY